MRRLLQVVRPYVECALSPGARRRVAAAFVVDFAFVFVFIVALQAFLRHQYFDGRYLPALALSAYAAGKLALQAAGGRLVDRLGWGRAATAALAGILVTQVLLLAAGASTLVLLLGAFAYGGAGATFWPAAYAGAAAEFGPESRARITSALAAASGAGMAAALATGVALPASFPFSAAIALACIAVALTIPMFAGVSQASGRAAAASAAPVFVRGVFDRRVGSAATIMLLQSAAIAGLVSVFRAFGRDELGLGLRAEVAGFALPGAMLALGVVLAGVAGHRFGRGALLPAAFLLAGLSLLVVGGTSEPLVALAMATLAALGLGVAIPSTTALVMDVAQGATSGAVFGVVLSFEGLGQVLGPLAAGIPRDPGIAIQAAGCILLLAMLAASRQLIDVRPAAAGLEGEVALASEAP